MSQKLTKVLNALLVDIFNDIMVIERESLRKGHFSDLSVTEMHTLEAIGRGEKTMTDVAEELDITVGTLTTAINRLVKKEYVERQRSDKDRRVVKVKLTHNGQLAYRVHEKFHQDMVKAMIEGLDMEHEQLLIDSLEKLSGFFRERYHLK